ncbi:HYR domain-containing protein [Gillisia sp. Hel_I_29]|uniref:HYR domain-containing protein n=1 Tax=Gillisia sp. Hel_I_29 TaxID=1249975 RepID=UPI0005517D7C|nr:HYR domain-containing protein [Gillisia sp. Hel_I_29]
MKRIILLTAFLLMSLASYAHAVQTFWELRDDGTIRFWLEHWHGDVNANTMMSYYIVVDQGNGQENIAASGYYNNTDFSNLDVQGAVNNRFQCGSANGYGDWVYYDFYPSKCNETVTISFVGAPPSETTPECPGLYGYSITQTFYDKSAPIVNANDLDVSVNQKSCTYSAGSFSNVTITDNCDSDPSVIYSVSGSAIDPASYSFPIGSTIVTVKATDNTGYPNNYTTTQTFKVNVSDLEPPAFNLYGDGSIDNPFITLQSEVVGKVASGTYYFKFNNSTFQGVLDNDTAGGGWLMILNYVHQGGTNPNLNVRNSNLPLLGSSTLGDNEAASSTWGHFGNTLAAALDFEEVRFYGQTSLTTSGIVNFTTKYSAAINYIKTGTGSFAGINNTANYTLLGNHSATIPANAPDVYSDQGDLALTNFPFWRQAQAHWGIKGDGIRWEVDGYPNNFNNSTIHRVWVRGDLSPAESEVKTEITIELDENGSTSISASDFNITALDNCGSVTYSLSQTDFDCSNIGANTIQYIATDEKGNNSSIDVVVNVEDKTAPTITCPGNMELDNDPGIDFAVATYNVLVSDNCEIPQPEKTDFTTLGSFEGKFYYLSNASFLPGDAFTHADLNGGNIVSINNAAENKFLDDAVSINNVLIGLTDLEVEGKFVWENGEALTYTNWNPNEPNNSGNEDYTELYGGGKWNDMLGTDIRQYILEVTMATQTAGLSSGSEFPIGTTTNTFEVTDASGNKSTCSFDVVVKDVEAPKGYTVSIDQADIDDTNETAVSFTFAAAEVGTTYNYTFSSENGGTDVSGTGTISTATDQITGIDLSRLEDGTIMLSVTLTDEAENEGIAVTDTKVKNTNEAPVAVCKAFTAQLDASGKVTITAVNVDGGSSDEKEGFTLSLDKDTFTCSDLGEKQVELTITDSDGAKSSCFATVKVEDNIAPVITSIEDIEVDTDTAICGAVVDYDITALDNCEIPQPVKPNFTALGSYNGKFYYLSNSMFNPESAFLDAKSNGGYVVAINDASENQFLAEVVLVNNVMIGLTDREVEGQYVWENGQAVTYTNWYAGEPNNSGNEDYAELYLGGKWNDMLATNSRQYILEVSMATQTAGLASGSVFPEGTTTNTFQATDASGNKTTYSFDVRVTDNESPKAVSKNITVELDETGSVTIEPSQIDDNSTDNCSISSLNFGGDNSLYAEVNEGQDLFITLPQDKVVTSVEFASYGTPTGTAGNYEIGTCNATNSKSILEGYALGKNSFTIPATNAVFGDPCSGTYKRLYVIVSYENLESTQTFTCSDVGDNTVTLVVTDVNGNVSIETAIVKVEDKVAAIAVAKDITVQLDDTGNVAITAEDVDNGSSDACGIASMSVSPNSFTCAEVGENSVTLTVIDKNGNESTTTSTVTVEDKVAALAIAKDITVQLDETGNVAITAADVDNGSSDACGIASMSVSPNNFTCANVGENTVTLTVIDNNGNVATTTSTVTVEDKVAAIAVAKDITVELDETGNVAITAADVENGSSDACGIASMSVSPNSFTCAEVGENTVTLTVIDNNGNVATTTSTVTVEDNVAAIAAAKDITVQLDDTGNVAITSADVDNGSSDACGIASMSVSPNSFTCANVGENTVTLTVVDNNGNVATTTSIVTVEDIVAAVAVAKDITVQLDETGNVVITAADVDNGSSDACGIASMSVSPNSFTCAEVGENTVTLTVIDNNGNESSTTSTVTVEDKVAAVAVAKSITLQLDETGKVAITAADVDNGSSDACGIASMSVSPNSFTCAEVGENTVTLTVIDVNGNVATTTSTVTVEDKVAAVAVAKDINVQLNETGKVAITAADVDNGSSDACGIASMSVSPNSFTCAEVGENTVTLTVIDKNGNVATTTSTVTVEDIVAAVAVAKDITVQLDETGKVAITAADVDNGSSDACGIASMSVSPNSFTCAEVGENTVTLTVIDKNGNESTTTSIVIVEDKFAAIAVAKNITVQLDETGKVAITAADVDNGSSDACGIASMSVSPNSFTCAEVGENTVTLTVIDNNGNVATSTSTLTVEDNIKPVPSISILEDITAECSVEQADVQVPTAKDNCNGAVKVTNNVTFPITASGLTTITWSFEDASGNVTTQTQKVTIKDETAPVPDAAELSDVVVECSIENIEVPTATDNCSGVITAVTNDALSYSDAGEYMILWEFTDASGNTSTQEQWITVKDVTTPEMNTKDITVSMFQNEPVVISPEDIDAGSSDNCSEVTLSLDKDTFNEPGEYLVTLSGTDAAGNIGSATALVTVKRDVPDAKGEMHVVPSILTGTTMTKVIAPLNSQIYSVQILETETNKYKTISGNKQQTMMIDVAPMRGTLLVRITDQTGKVHLKKIIVL